MCVHMCAWMWRCQRATGDVLALQLILDKVSHWAWSSLILDWPASELQGPTSLHFHCVGVTDMPCCSQLSFSLFGGVGWNTRSHAYSASTLPLSHTPQPHRQFSMCVLGIWTQVFMLHFSSCVTISTTRIPIQKTRVRELIAFPCKLPFSFLVHCDFRFTLSSSHSQVHTITLRFTSLKCKLWSEILIKRNWMPCWFNISAIVKYRCVFTIIESIIFIFDKEYS